MIEDYKVEAAVKAYWDTKGDAIKRLIAALEAAANAKPPEKVVVTEEQISAGAAELGMFTWVSDGKRYLRIVDFEEAVTNAYRAMRALEPHPHPDTLQASKDGTRVNLTIERRRGERRRERRALAAESICGSTLYDVGRGGWEQCRRYRGERRQGEGR